MSDAENLYGDHGRPAEDDEPEDESSIVGERQTARKEPEHQPAKRKLIVRGQIVEMTEDEILAAAQKTLAGDSYLDEAKQILAEARGIKKARTASDNQHPDGQEDAQLLDPDDTGYDAQHPEPSFRGVVEKIQYGDPEEAAVELERLVDTRATKQVTENHAKRLFDQDLARSQKALKGFIAANPDLANDEIAALAIERGMYHLYKEDIIKLGMAEDKIPDDPATLANWHRWYRVHGHEVRNTADLLNQSRDKFIAWRGGRSTEQPASAATEGSAPRSSQRGSRYPPRCHPPSTDPHRDATPPDHTGCSNYPV